MKTLREIALTVLLLLPLLELLLLPGYLARRTTLDLNLLNGQYAEVYEGDLGR
jgi:hypothetical protein